jgi:hypothetical protein
MVVAGLFASAVVLQPAHAQLRDIFLPLKTLLDRAIEALATIKETEGVAKVINYAVVRH